MEQSTIANAINYSTSLIGIPYRWYVEKLDIFNGKEKFWCENTPPPSVCEIILYGINFNYFFYC